MRKKARCFLEIVYTVGRLSCYKISWACTRVYLKSRVGGENAFLLYWDFFRLITSFAAHSIIVKTMLRFPPNLVFHNLIVAAMWKSIIICSDRNLEKQKKSLKLSVASGSSFVFPYYKDKEKLDGSIVVKVKIHQNYMMVYSPSCLQVTFVQFYKPRM